MTAVFIAWMHDPSPLVGLGVIVGLIVAIVEEWWCKK